MATGSRRGAGKKRRGRPKKVVYPVASWNDPAQDWDVWIPAPQVTHTPTEIEEDVKPVKKGKSVTIVDAPEGVELRKNNVGAEYYLDENGHQIFVAGGWRRCPRCGALDTVGVRNNKSVQGSDRSYVYHYRRCVRPTCRHSFSALRPN